MEAVERLKTWAQNCQFMISATFYWLQKVEKPAQIQGEGK